MAGGEMLTDKEIKIIDDEYKKGIE